MRMYIATTGSSVPESCRKRRLKMHCTRTDKSYFCTTNEVPSLPEAGLHSFLPDLYVAGEIGILLNLSRKFTYSFLQTGRGWASLSSAVV